VGPFLQDLRYSIRNLLRAPGFTATAVITLALGIGANAAIFSVVYAVLLRPLPYENPDRIVRFMDVQHGRKLNNSLPNVYDWRKSAQSFSAMAVANPFGGFTMTDAAGANEDISSSYIEGSVFTLLGVQPVAGRIFSVEEEKVGAPGTVMLSHSFWQRKFAGSAAVIGQSITLNTVKYTVVGVLPASFQLYPFKDVWVPLAPYVRELWMDRGNHGGFQTLARLKDGVTVQQAQAEMTQICKTLEAAYPAENRDLTVQLTLLQESQVGYLASTMNLLLGAVSLVLLMACVNVAGLVLARHISREREVAIRAALGAGRAQLVRLLLSESVILAIAGGVAGTLLALWAVDLLPQVWRAPSTVGAVRVDGTVLAYSAGLSLATALLFGVLPAWQASRGWMGAALRQTTGTVGGSLRRQITRRALAAIEVAMCLALLGGAGVMIRTFSNLAEVNPGFAAENLLAVNISQPVTLDSKQVPQFNQGLREKLQNVPGVRAVGYSWPYSYSGMGWTPKVNFYENPVRDGEERMMDTSAVTQEYFAAMGIPLKQGRTFTRDDRAGARIVAVVSEEFVRVNWPGQNPLGKRLRFIGIPELQDLQVVGVVGNTLRNGPAGQALPEIYCAFDQFPVRGGTFVVRTAGEPSAAVASLREAVKQSDGQVALLAARPLAQIMSSMLSDRRLVRLILGLFAGVALLLAAVGIYGVVAFSVANRTREIGVRMALGARPSSVMQLVVGQGLLPVAVGVAVGLGAAIALAGYLKTFVYGVAPYDPLTLAAAGTLLLFTGTLACLIPARRAARIDPMIALRHE